MLLLGCVLFLAALPLQAQLPTAKVAGTVTDPSGAVTSRGKSHADEHEQRVRVYVRSLTLRRVRCAEPGACQLHAKGRGRRL